MEEDILELLPQERNKRITKRPIAWLYDIEFDDDIMEPKYYREDMDVFRNASANDTIRVRINSAGGYLHTAIQYVTNMTATEAETIAVLEGEAHSGASMVFLAADQHMVSPHAAMLIHEPRGGMYDSSAKLHAQADFNRPYIKALYHDYYKHFLSEKEIDDVLDGKDIWLNAESIVERLKYRNQQRELEEEQWQEVEEIESNEGHPEFDEDSYMQGKQEHQDSVVKYLCKRYKKDELAYAFGTLLGNFFNPEEYTKQQLILEMLSDGVTEKDIVDTIEENKT